MWLRCLLLLAVTNTAYCQFIKCDQTPPDATIKEPSQESHPFVFDIENAQKRDGKILFTPAQTYVLSVTTTNTNRTFRWFMITAEDPGIDNITYMMRTKEPQEVGSLKSLDISVSRHSERCANSVEKFDNSPKTRVEIHWVSPIDTAKVRIRAMVAENEETWYVGPSLTMILMKEETQPQDSSPFPPNVNCRICSEARYEVVFNGKWSRVAHPRHYPTKPDDNGYTHMVGASHDTDYFLWNPGSKASDGFKQLLENGNTTLLEREIIDAMEVESGTRTLIRGKRRRHPYMFEPSHSLFRTDHVHHMFSIVVGMRPSPDWFLGMTQFELCIPNEEGVDEWLEQSEVPLFPWDAGTRNGVSYESETSPSEDNIERVEVGSFNQDSPFYQKNLNDLQRFATLQVRRLDVYELDESLCPGEDTAEEGETGARANMDSDSDPQPYPLLGESRQKLDFHSCVPGAWSDWSECVPDAGTCGLGSQSKTWLSQYEIGSENSYHETNCQDDETTQFRHCYLKC